MSNKESAIDWGNLASIEVKFIDEMLMDFPSPDDLVVKDKSEHKAIKKLDVLIKDQKIQKKRLLEHQMQDLKAYQDNLLSAIDFETLSNEIPPNRLENVLHEQQLKHLRDLKVPGQPGALDRLPAELRHVLVDLGQFNGMQEKMTEKQLEDFNSISLVELELEIGKMLSKERKEMQDDEFQMRMFHQSEREGLQKRLVKDLPGRYGQQKPQSALKKDRGTSLLKDPSSSNVDRTKLHQERTVKSVSFGVSHQQEKQGGTVLVPREDTPLLHDQEQRRQQGQQGQQAQPSDPQDASRSPLYRPPSPFRHRPQQRQPFSGDQSNPQPAPHRDQAVSMDSQLQPNNASDLNQSKIQFDPMKIQLQDLNGLKTFWDNSRLMGLQPGPYVSRQATPSIAKTQYSVDPRLHGSMFASRVPSDGSEMSPPVQLINGNSRNDQDGLSQPHTRERRYSAGQRGPAYVDLTAPQLKQRRASEISPRKPTAFTAEALRRTNSERTPELRTSLGSTAGSANLPSSSLGSEPMDIDSSDMAVDDEDQAPTGNTPQKEPPVHVPSVVEKVVLDPMVLDSSELPAVDSRSEAMSTTGSTPVRPRDRSASYSSHGWDGSSSHHSRDSRDNERRDSHGRRHSREFDHDKSRRYSRDSDDTDKFGRQRRRSRDSPERHNYDDRDESRDRRGSGTMEPPSRRDRRNSRGFADRDDRQLRSPRWDDRENSNRDHGKHHNRRRNSREDSEYANWGGEGTDRDRERNHGHRGHHRDHHDHHDRGGYHGAPRRTGRRAKRSGGGHHGRYRGYESFRPDYGDRDDRSEEYRRRGSPSPRSEDHRPYKQRESSPDDWFSNRAKAMEQ